MHRKEINERSPLRVLEKSIHGGLGRGNLGVIVARHGVGKTAVLVGVALDDLMRGKKVLHVSLKEGVERVREFYDDIFQDLAHSQQLEDVWKVRLDLERNRRIHCYAPEAFSADKLRETLRFMSDHGDFTPSAIMLDGLDFETIERGLLDDLRELARATDAELWLTALTTRDADTSEIGVPAPVSRLEDALDVILTIAHDGSSVHVSLRKDHENPTVPDLKLELDPRTLLLQKS